MKINVGRTSGNDGDLFKLGAQTMTRSSLTLPKAIYGFVLLGAVLFAFTAAFVVFDRVRTIQIRALEEAVQIRGSHAAADLATALRQDWQNLTAISERLVTGDPAALRAALDLVAGEGKRIAWAGFAGADGKVISSSNGLMLGADVSSRPWFHRGLKGDFAGQVQEAFLLNPFLSETKEKPARFIGLATPVTSLSGRTIGVLAFHVSFEWAEAYMAEIAESLELDLFLVSSGGEVIVATDRSSSDLLDLQSFRAAATGVESVGRERWPDGKEYFTAVAPQIVHEGLPPANWRLIARISPDVMGVVRTDMTLVLAQALLVAFVAILGMTVLFIRIFIAPIGELADNAKRIAGGADEYPMESNRSAELAKLSAALAQLQGRHG